MKQAKQKLLSAALITALLIQGAMPMAVQATEDEIPDTDLVQEEVATGSNMPFRSGKEINLSGDLDLRYDTSQGDIATDGYTWDSDTKTLTLQDITVDGAIKLPDEDCMVLVEGAVHFTSMEKPGGSSAPITMRGEGNTVTGNFDLQGELTLDSVSLEGKISNSFVGGDKRLTLKDSTVTTTSLNWSPNAGIMLDNSQLNVSNHFWAEKIIMDDDSAIQMDTELKNHANVPDGLDGLINYLPAGYRAGLYKNSFNTDVVTIVDADGNIASGFSIRFPGGGDPSKNYQDPLFIEEMGEKTYGDSAFNLATTGGSGTGAVTFESSDPSIVSIDGMTAVIHKAGTVTITATKAADDKYSKAFVKESITIKKKPITFTAWNHFNVERGKGFPPLGYLPVELAAGDFIITQPTVTTNRVDANSLGEFVITISGAEVSNGDSYIISYQNGIMVVVDGGGSNDNSDNSDQGNSGTTSNKDKITDSYTGGATPLSGFWHLKEDGTWNFLMAGQPIKGRWECLANAYAKAHQPAGGWFVFDGNGTMLTNWYTDMDGKTYYLQAVSDGTLGMMLTGWRLIDGKWYYFNTDPKTGTFGALVTNTTTPDGYVVNEKGEWVSQN